MERHFKVPISAVDVHPKSSDTLALGFINGNITCGQFDSVTDARRKGRKRGSLRRLWTARLKSAVRDVKFAEDGAQLYVIGANWSLSVFDVESGKRLRCVRKCHEARPNKICLLPSYLQRDQVATGSEDGEIRLWDFRLDDASPFVHSFSEQEDIVNDLKVHKHWLLSACGDGTLAAYDLRKRKLFVQSEVMHSELMSIAVTDKYTYAGGSDGFIEVFINGQYGNLLERIETPFDMGVDCLLVLRPQLLLVGSEMADEMRFFHVNPNKQLHAIAQEGGVDTVLKSADSRFLIATSSDACTLAVRPLHEMIKDVPVLKSQEVRDMKSDGGVVKSSSKKRRRELERPDPSFFKGLCNDAEDTEEADGD